AEARPHATTLPARRGASLPAARERVARAAAKCDGVPSGGAVHGRTVPRAGEDPGAGPGPPDSGLPARVREGAGQRARAEGALRLLRALRRRVVEKHARRTR